MIDNLKPYAERKDSGLPWLGKVPKHWEIKRGKSYLTCVDKRSKTGKEELLTVSSSRGVVPRNSATVTMFKAKSYVGYKLCWPGDLVINSLWAWGGGLGVTQHHGIISTAYSVYRTRPTANLLPRYLHELVRSAAFNWELHVRSKGIWISRLQLTDTAFLDTPLPLPPPDEQAAIVKFLDYANGKIERAIRAKRKLIGLLNEQKQAIIHRAVTRGLDPNVKLKPSGIPWLGDVPEHWEVTNLGRLTFSFKTGPFGSILHQSDYVIGGIPLINPVHMSDGRINPNPNCTVDQATFDRLREYSLRDGDLVFSRRGELGRCALAREEANGWLIGTGSIRVRLLEAKINKDYLIAALRGRWVADYLSLSSVGATMQSLNTGILKLLPLPLPPPEEQAQIPMVIERDTAVILAAIARAEREIHLLREYRTTLTAEVVTGKLDVREAAKRLPDQADEPLTLDDSLEDLEDDEIAEEIEA